MSTLAQIKADTIWYLQQWPEPCMRRRPTTVYDSRGIASQSWTSSLSFTGDFQALTGAQFRAEQGLKQRSDWMVVADYSMSFEPDDRIDRHSADGSFDERFVVNYLREYEEHTGVFVYRELQQP